MVSRSSALPTRSYHKLTNLIHTAPSAQALAIIKSYDVFIGHITSLGVEEAYDVRPVLNVC